MQAASKQQASGNSSREKENNLAEFSYQPAAKPEGRTQAGDAGSASQDKVSLDVACVLMSCIGCCEWECRLSPQHSAHPSSAEVLQSAVFADGLSHWNPGTSLHLMLSEHVGSSIALRLYMICTFWVFCHSAAKDSPAIQRKNVVIKDSIQDVLRPHG